MDVLRLKNVGQLFSHNNVPEWPVDKKLMTRYKNKESITLL